MIAGVLAVVIIQMTGRPQALAGFFDHLSNLLNEEVDSYTLVAVSTQDREEQSFINGVRMAVEAVNATEEKILGKKLVLDWVGEEGISPSTSLESTVRKTMTLSDRIAQTKNLMAVIGHEWTDTAVTASSIYSLNKIMFLATQATATSLTNHKFDTVFAMQPDNATNAHVVASYALSQGIKRIIVLSDKSDYAKESSNFFTEAMTKAGADLVYRGYLSGTDRSTDDLLMFILDNPLFTRKDFDAFFIVSSSNDDTAKFIKRARYLGLDVPILGMEYIFSAAVESEVGKPGMKDTIGVSLYDRDNISERGKAFAKDYQERFKHLPDLNAALGYDAVMLLRDAIERAQTLDPNRISDTLKVARYKAPFAGVTGPLVFDRNGLITDTDIFIVRHDGDEFHTVATFSVPLKNKAASGNKLPSIDGLNAQPSELHRPPNSTETLGQ